MMQKDTNSELKKNAMYEVQEKANGTTDSKQQHGP
jgi:hypothetical protein